MEQNNKLLQDLKLGAKTINYSNGGFGSLKQAIELMETRNLSKYIDMDIKYIDCKRQRIKISLNDDILYTINLCNSYKICFTDFLKKLSNIDLSPIVEVKVDRITWGKCCKKENVDKVMRQINEEYIKEDINLSSRQLSYSIFEHNKKFKKCDKKGDEKITGDELVELRNNEAVERFKTMVEIFKLWKIKTEKIKEEASKIGFKLLSGEEEAIRYIKDDTIVYETTNTETSVGTIPMDLTGKITDFTSSYLLPQNMPGRRCQFYYTMEGLEPLREDATHNEILKHQINTTYIPLTRYIRMSKEDREKCTKHFIGFKDHVEQTNFFCDTETDFIFYKDMGDRVLSPISKNDYIDGEEYMKKCFDENKKPEYRVLKATKVITIQYALNIRGESIYKIFVDESKRNDFNEEEITKDFTRVGFKKCEIIYSNDIQYHFWCDIVNTLRTEEKVRVWFHNLKFDALNIGLFNHERLSEFGLTFKTINHTSPKFYTLELMNEMEKNCKLCFCDSANFFMTKLEKLGEMCGIQKEKELVNFDISKDLERDGANCKVDKEFLEYAFGDVVILERFMLDFFEKVKPLSKIKMGAAGTSFTSFLWKFYTPKDGNGIQVHRNKYLNHIEKRAYFGGRTQVFNRTGLWKDIVSMDINSSYPSSMGQKLPVRYMYTKLNQNINYVKSILDSSDKYIISDVTVSDNNQIVPVMDARTKLKVFGNVNNFRCMLHEAEIRKLIEKKSKIIFHEVHVYNATNTLFNEFVKHFMTEKVNAKLIKDALAEATAKLFANSCYGKFGECGQKTDMIEIDEEVLDAINCENTCITDAKSFVGVVTLDGENHNVLAGVLHKKSYTPNEEIIDGVDINEYMEKYSSIAIAGAITSYSRVALYDAMEKIGFKNICYCDTDSIYFKKPDNFEELVQYVELEKNEITGEYYKDLETAESKLIPNKIYINKAFVSAKYFWGLEYKGEVFDMLVQGNKDNIKIRDGKIMNSKNKGIGKNAIKIADNRYIDYHWYGIAETSRKYNIADTQLIELQLKDVSNSRNNYSKATVLEKATKVLSFKSYGEYEDIDGELDLGEDKISFTEQLIQTKEYTKTMDDKVIERGIIL